MLRVAKLQYFGIGYLSIDITATFGISTLRGSHMIMSNNANNFRLDGFPIHPIWRYSAFRNANFSEHLSIPELDRPQYNIDEGVYDRMKPGLRLATLFLELVTPELAHIFNAGVEPQPYHEEKPSQRLSAWRGTPAKYRALNAELVRLSKMYRVTAFRPKPQGGDKDEPKCYFIKTDTAVTDLIWCPSHTRPYKQFYPQSAICTTWQAFFERQDWDTIGDDEKNARLLLLAVTLIHELAYVVWFHRVSRYYELSAKKGRKDFSDIEFDPSEPVFGERQWAECGYVIEESLVSGYLSYSNIVQMPNYPNPPRNCVLYAMREWPAVGQTQIQVNEVPPHRIEDFFIHETWQRGPDAALAGYHQVAIDNLTDRHMARSFVLQADPML